MHEALLNLSNSFSLEALQAKACPEFKVPRAYVACTVGDVTSRLYHILALLSEIFLHKY